MEIPFIHLDIPELVKTVGYIGLFIIVFAESGLFFGFFLPGGSLLFTAGLLASQGYFNIYFLGALLATAAISGDSTGYWFGRKVGPSIFSKEDSLFFNKKHIEHTKNFYEKYGPRTIILGRFVPIVRTFAPILAGVGSMDYKKFLSYNITGGILWGVGMTLMGYFLGTYVPNTEKYLTFIIVGIVLFSVIPIIIEITKKKLTKNS